MRSFYLGDRLNASGGSETAGTGWVKFRECGHLLYGRKNGRIY